MSPDERIIVVVGGLSIEQLDLLIGAGTYDDLVARETFLVSPSPPPPMIIEAPPPMKMLELRPDPLSPFEIVRERDRKKRKFRT
jgi:hypothetical protein